MKALAKIDAKQVEEMTFSITFRMKVREWRELMDQARKVGAWPSFELAEKISEVMRHLDRCVEFQIGDANVPE